VERNVLLSQVVEKLVVRSIWYDADGAEHGFVAVAVP